MIYTEVTLEQVQVHLQRIGAGRAVGREGLSGGLANTNYRVERQGAGPLVLKVCAALDLAEAERVAGVCAYLADNGVPTPAPLKGVDGLVDEVDGRPWMLQPFVEGGWLQSTPASVTELGRALARLHSVAPPPGLRVGFPMGFGLWDEVLAEAAELGSEHPFIGRLQRLRDELGHLAVREDLPRGIVHGDLFSQNVLTVGDRVSALLDFEDVSHEAFCLDIAMTFVGCGWSDGAPQRSLWDALIAGYECVRALTSAERAALPEYSKLATMGIATWRFRQFDLHGKVFSESGRYLEMTTRLDRLGGLY